MLASALLLAGSALAQTCQPALLGLQYGTYQQGGSPVPLLLDLYRPAGATAPTPVIVWVHGGGWQAGTRAVPPNVQQLCGRGYAIAGIAVLAVAICGAIFLISDVLYGTQTTVIATASIAAVFLTVWYLLPLYRRSKLSDQIKS